MAYPLLRDAHAKLVFNRRVQALIDALGAQIRSGDHILDVGAGDGQIALGVAQSQSNTRVEGIDIMIRPETHIDVTVYDGTTIPFEDNSVDVVTFVDVLHHTDVQARLIAEAARVARRAVIIKDHLSENGLDHATLRFMDWIGNAPHGVVLPYNYASRQTWDTWFSEAGLRVDTFEKRIPLYPFPFNMVFGRGLHFVAVLTKQA